MPVRMTSNPCPYYHHFRALLVHFHRDPYPKRIQTFDAECISPRGTNRRGMNFLMPHTLWVLRVRGSAAAGAQAILTALSSCPKDADVQRWGCEALIPLFGDPVIATSYREAGLEAVLRGFAMLQGVETALKNMGIAPACGSWKHKNDYDEPREEANKYSRASPARKRWDRAIKMARSLLCSVLLFPRAVYS